MRTMGAVSWVFLWCLVLAFAVLAVTQVWVLFGAPGLILALCVFALTPLGLVAGGKD